MLEELKERILAKRHSCIIVRQADDAEKRNIAEQKLNEEYGWGKNQKGYDATYFKKRSAIASGPLPENGCDECQSLGGRYFNWGNAEKCLRTNRETKPQEPNISR